MKLYLKTQREQFAGVHSFFFQPEEPFLWTPGQYMHYVLEHENADDRGTERWFTISSAPFEHDIVITTRIDDEHSSSFKTALMSLKKGDVISADGPKGKFVLQDGGHHVFIAGGIGITPFRSMLAQLDHDGTTTNIDLLWSNRDKNFVYGNEIDAIASRYRTLKVTKFVDQRIEKEDLETYLNDSSAIFYVSGPEPMVEVYKKLLEEAAVEESRLMTDDFPGYDEKA